MSFSFPCRQNLPDNIFEDIMLMAGLGSLQDLHKCRQVCQRWKVMISQMTKQKKDNIRRRAESLAPQIRRGHYDDFVTAACLHHHGILIGSVDFMKLDEDVDVDLASVPAEHLASLASCVTNDLIINNVSNCDLVSILDSVKCKGLKINRQTLSCEETQALVRAMESGVEVVVLGLGGEVSLDFRALTQYSGQGKCERLVCYADTADTYSREEVRSWAEKNNWTALMRHDYFDLIQARSNISFLSKFGIYTIFS